MPKAIGHSVKGLVRLNRDLYRFEGYIRGETVRKTFTADAFATFLKGEVDSESNLASEAEPITLAQFCDESYIPFAAKPRLLNPRSLSGERDLLKALCKVMGTTYLHEIKPHDGEQCKIHWLSRRYANNTIKKNLNCLRRIVDHAVSVGRIKKNPLLPVRGLKSESRSEIWLRLVEIDMLLRHCHPVIRNLVEFLVLTGARINEALALRAGDVRDGKLYLPTEKRRRPAREAMRQFDIASLGPRFARLLGELRPNPKSGYYFFAHKRRVTALSYPYFARLFDKARRDAGLAHIRPHDLRGTFAIHRAMVVHSFRQLQVELGHTDARSIQSYLNRAQHFDARESIFYVAPPQEAPSKASLMDSPQVALVPQTPPGTGRGPKPFVH